MRVEVGWPTSRSRSGGCARGATTPRAVSGTLAAHDASTAWRGRLRFANRDLARARPDRHDALAPTRPPHPDCRRGRRESHDLDRPVLRPIARATVHFPCGTPRSVVYQPYRRPDRVRVQRRADQPHPQATPGALVPIQTRLPPVLRPDDIRPTVPPHAAQRTAR